ncbi:MAG: spore maturation protein [Christensenellaceae bacterium]|jgi:spore maturation protein B|nr:spore maturation protein [Christensenellaceae bacterium]
MIVLLLTACAFFYAAFSGKAVYSAFVDGAMEGLKTAAKVVPYVAAALLLIGALRACGALAALGALLAPVTGLLGIPEELLPLLMLRPLSGSAALAELDLLIAEFGPDSYIVRTACAMMGSSETILYTIALYLGSIQVKRSRYILPIGLIAGLFSAIFAAFFCRFA